MWINKIQTAIIVIIIPLGLVYWFTSTREYPIAEFFFPGTAVMHFEDIPVRVEIANSDEERIQGLSGRTEIENANGMLFVFPEAGFHSIWMKDMRFPIDIIWIDADLTVIGIEENVTPDTYPRSFRPERPAQYAVETEPLYSDTMGIHAGVKVKLPPEYLED